VVHQLHERDGDVRLQLGEPLAHVALHKVCAQKESDQTLQPAGSLNAGKGERERSRRGRERASSLTPQLSCCLDTSGSATNDDKVEEALLFVFCGGGQGSQLEAVQHLIADGHGIGDLLEEQAVVLHAGCALSRQTKATMRSNARRGEERGGEYQTCC